VVGHPQLSDVSDLESIPDSDREGLLHVGPAGKTDYSGVGFTKIGEVQARPGDETDPIYAYTNWTALA
jgi:hypothetical protein